MKKIFLLVGVCLLAATAPTLAQSAPGASVTPAGMKAPVAVAEYYEGGQEAMYAFIEKELKYPVEALRRRVRGTTILSFTLNMDGTMSGIKLVKGIGGGCDAEAERVVRLLKFKKPPYPVLTSLPIVFKLPGAAPAAAASPQ
ncbi:energy transducer TonB [Hymenobacter sp. BT175]|uniref:energy transducer TonB n=1 Tax=Hymenobacter translucens TaxID=2886507 RepID=UPI001D0E0EFA|nr:energy transducer TonB [Hymenobacter translucens]MCC2545082.1 energy transducer TonB [Hymenobacter translucens]